MDEDLKARTSYLKKEKYTIPFIVPNGHVPNEYFTGSLLTTLVLDKTGKMRMKHDGMADIAEILSMKKSSAFDRINILEYLSIYNFLLIKQISQPINC